MTDIQKLKALAEAVRELEDQPEKSYEHEEAKDALWLHMHCHTVLDLIAEIERYRYALRRVFRSTDGAFPVDGKWLVQIQTMKLVEKALYGRGEALDSDGDLSYALILTERQQLKTENTDLHATLQAAKGEIERLKGESEALRKAFREISGQVDGNIRCTVRDVVNGLPDVQDIYGYCDTIDEIIDAAMSEEASHD